MIAPVWLGKPPVKKVMFHWTFSVPPSIYRHSSLIFGEKYLPQRVCVLEGGLKTIWQNTIWAWNAVWTCSIPMWGIPWLPFFVLLLCFFHLKKASVIKGRTPNQLGNGVKTILFLLMVQFSKKIVGPNFFNPMLTRPKLFQTESTQSLHN